MFNTPSIKGYLDTRINHVNRIDSWSISLNWIKFEFATLKYDNLPNSILNDFEKDLGHKQLLSI